MSIRGAGERKLLPPARAEALLKRWASTRAGRFIVADLGEEYRELTARRSLLFCRLWYWAQALPLTLRFAANRGRRSRLRESRGTRLFDTLHQDLRYAFRNLSKSPAFTLAAVLALAVGIGANTAIFSVVYGVLQTLPYPGGQRIVLAYEGDAQTRVYRMMLAPAEIGAIEELEGELFEAVAAYGYTSVLLEGDPNPEQVPAARLSHDFMDMLEVRPYRGREFTADDDPDSRVVVLGYALWQRRFGGDENLVGRDVRLNGEPHAVIGISAPDFNYFNDTNRVFLPLAFTAEQGADLIVHNVYPLARLRPGLDLAAADERVRAAVAARQEAGGHRDDRERDVWLERLYDAWVGSVRQRLMLLMGFVGLLVLIACSNVAGLQMARGLRRGREIAIRLALGASRVRMVRQLVTESTLLAGLGGIVGLLLAWTTVGWLRAAVQQQLPRADNIDVDLAVLGFTFGLSALSGILSGLAPAWVATRGELARPLGEGRRTIAGGRGGRLRSALLVTQVALAVVLAVGAVLLLRSFNNVRERELGFEANDVIISLLDLYGRPEYTEPAQRRAFFEAILARLEVFPEVESSGAIYLPPGTANMISYDFYGDRDDEPVSAGFYVMTPGTIDALGMKLLRGRDFGAADGPGAEPVAVVNEAMAERMWSGRDPLGRSLQVGERDDDSMPVTVVGLVANVRQTPLSDPDLPRVYLPMAQRPPSSVALLARLRGPRQDFADRFRHAVAEIDPGQPVAGLAPLSDVLSRVIAADRVNSALLSLFAALALTLAALGEYTVIHQMVGHRSGEIGIRMALGATAPRVLTMVMRQGLVLAVVGVVLGTGGAWFGSRLLESMLHDVVPTDPLSYGAVAAVLLAVALSASLLPARRAARIDPVSTLRQG